VRRAEPFHGPHVGWHVNPSIRRSRDVAKRHVDPRDEGGHDDLDDVDDVTGVQVQVGDRGSNGPVIFVLSNDSSHAPTGLLESDDLVAAPDVGIDSFDDAIDAMVDGRTYVNVLTGANPGGEIRGQIEK